jgi:cell filamentation protein
VEELAIFIGDLIHLHPFREGNGRAIREFVRQLCKTNGYDINYGLVKPKERLEAEIEAYNCKYNKLIEVLKIELIEIKK